MKSRIDKTKIISQKSVNDRDIYQINVTLLINITNINQNG
jgi:hypothetical protein